MSKSTKTSSTSNSTVKTTPDNPEWVTQGVQGLQDRINGLLSTDASTLVPDASALQGQAFSQATGLGARTGAAADAAQSLFDSPAQATSRSLLDVNLGDYQNPFQKDVIDTTLAGYDEQAGMKRAELAAAQARGQKFSGSGSAIERALFERGSAQDRAAQEASLRSAGFDKATGLATTDLNREADTSQFNAGQANSTRTAAAGLLGQAAASDRADLGLLSDLGGQQREIDRQKLGANTELLKLVSALQSSQPYSLFQGQTRTGNETSTSKSTTSDPMGTIGGLLQGAGSLASGLGAMGVMFSDKRLKEDIKPHGKDDDGRPMVSYRYKGEPKDVRRVGHLAQDVEKTDPHAIKRIGKYKAIDYGLLGEGAC